MLRTLFAFVVLLLSLSVLPLSPRQTGIVVCHSGRALSRGERGIAWNGVPVSSDSLGDAGKPLILLC